MKCMVFTLTFVTALDVTPKIQGCVKNLNRYMGSQQEQQC